MLCPSGSVNTQTSIKLLMAFTAVTLIRKKDFKLLRRQIVTRNYTMYSELMLSQYHTRCSYNNSACLKILTQGNYIWSIELYVYSELWTNVNNFTIRTSALLPAGIRAVLFDWFPSRLLHSSLSGWCAWSPPFFTPLRWSVQIGWDLGGLGGCPTLSNQRWQGWWRPWLSVIPT